MSINWKVIREEEYPALKESELTYFLSAGASLMNKSSYEIGIDYFNRMHNQGDIGHEHFWVELEHIRKLVAEYLNINPYEVAFLVNTSSGIAASAYMLNRNRGEVLYPSIEFPTSIHMFERLGYTCKRIKDEDGMYPVESFGKYLSDDTKYIIHSHVQSFNGFKQDLSQLGSFCSKNNLINIVNSTQAFGAFEIDIERFNIDVLITNALKWIGSGYGIGIICIKEELVDKYHLPFTGWLSVDNPFAMDNQNLNVIRKPRSMDSLGGCPNFASLLPLKGALNLIKNTIGAGSIQKGIKAIENRIISLTTYFLDKISAFNLKIITPTDEKYRSGIITLEHHNSKKIHRYLTKNNVFTTLKQYPNSLEHILIRFAINYYNNYNDIDQAIRLLNSCKYLK